MQEIKHKKKEWGRRLYGFSLKSCLLSIDISFYNIEKIIPKSIKGLVMSSMKQRLYHGIGDYSIVIGWKVVD